MGGIEREVKLAAWAGLVLPDLTDVVPGGSVVALRPLRQRATYYDTADLRLARAGISLRYRSETALASPDTSASGSPAGSRSGGWTVKFPEGDDGPGLARREVDVRGGEGRIPPSVLHLVRAQVRSASLVPVVRLRTERHRVELRDSDGKRVVEIDDDEVSVLVSGPDGRGRRVAARFREIEAELTDSESTETLETVVARLREAGAGAPDPTPKVVRALGPRATAPADVVADKISDRSTAGDAVRAAIAASVARLLTHDPGVRIGEDPEDVHQARVATRRLRSDLRTFRPLLDADWVGGLRDELGWIAELLGAVRDTDVLLEHLQADVRRLDVTDAAAGAAVLRRLETQRRAARVTLLAALDSDRYVALLDGLVEAAQSPRFAPVVPPEPPGSAEETPAPEVTPDPAPMADAGAATGWRPLPAVPAVEAPEAPSPQAITENVDGSAPSPAPDRAPEPPLSPDDPAKDALPALVRRPWRQLRRAVEEIGPVRPEDETLHHIRILSKRCRYAAEAVVPAIGKPAAKFGAAVAEVQGVLGDLNDAVVAEAWLREAAGRAPAAQVLVVGELIALQRRKAAACRVAWEEEWRKASAKQLREWLTRP